MAKAPNILCFISSKGGSGKTVTSASLGTFLSQLGFRVLLVDTDAATNGMTLLFLEQLLRGTQIARSDRGAGLFEAKNGVTPTVISITEHLALVPATFRIEDTEQVDPEVMRNNLLLVLEEANDFDVVLLDAQAGADKFAKVSTELSDVHVIVSEYDPISAQGIDRLKLIFARELAPASTFTLFNKILPEFAKALGEGMAVARWLPPIPWDIEVVRSFTRRDLAINIEAPNPYTLGIAQVALGCLDDLTSDAISSWQKRSLERATSPIEQRLAALEEARSELRRKTSRLRLYSKMIEYLTVIIAPLSVLAFTQSLDVWSVLSKRMFEASSFSLSLGFAVAVASVVAILVAVQSTRRESDSSEIDVVDTEILQLRANLEASRASLSPGEIGVWQTLRQSRRQEK